MLILVRGGVAEFVADGMVLVGLVDYDNDPDAPTPAGFEDMVDWTEDLPSHCSP